MAQKKDMGKILRQFGLVFVALIIIIFMSITSDVFLTSQNIINILRQISINAYIALGMTFIIILGHIDLSVGAIVAMSGTLTVGLVVNQGIPVGPAILLGLQVSAMWVIGLGFAAMLAYGIVKGRQLDREKDAVDARLLDSDGTDER